MGRREPVKIANMEEFVRCNEIIFWCNGVQPDICLEVAHYFYWEFIDGYSEAALNADIQANADLFNWEETWDFYYPNTNMHSYSNEVRQIHGYYLTVTNKDYLAWCQGSL